MSEKRILLCEDDQNLRSLLTSILEFDGHIVAEFGTADEALSLDETELAGFDVLLTDIEMPGMDGLSLAREMSAEYPRMTILLMSGRVPDFDRLEPRNACFYRKPFSLAELREAIAQTRTGVLRDI